MTMKVMMMVVIMNHGDDDGGDDDDGDYDDELHCTHTWPALGLFVLCGVLVRCLSCLGELLLLQNRMQALPAKRNCKAHACITKNDNTCKTTMATKLVNTYKHARPTTSKNLHTTNTAKATVLEPHGYNTDKMHT